jgi:hypothetical protein
MVIASVKLITKLVMKCLYISLFLSLFFACRNFKQSIHCYHQSKSKKSVILCLCLITI